MTPQSPTTALHELQERQNDLVLSYVTVRQNLGVLGLFLPLSLLVYAAWPGHRLEASISDFYYTEMGGVLTGTLAAIGVFLISYRGYQRLPGEWLSDKWLSRIAGAAALGVALFPVHREGYPICPEAGGQTTPCWIFGSASHPEAVHYLSAIAFFGCMALFCLVQFPRGERGPDGHLVWSARTVTYLSCGTIILAAMVALGPYFFADTDTRAVMTANKYLFWCETLGVTAFATSWLVKGKALTGLWRTLSHLAPGSRKT
ncbi:MAG: hypothetical protein R3E44_00045 [Paracoccaceae bacterium]